MATSVVGLFDKESQAQEVADELIAQGIPRGAIEIIKGQKTETAASSAKSFFQRLAEKLGISGDHHIDPYDEGVRRGGTLEVVEVADEQADAVVVAMQRHGAVNVDERAGGFQTQPGRPATAVASTTIPTAAATTASAEVAVPVIEEELHVGKRVVQRGGVRVFTHVSERPVEEEVRLREERVKVERHPTDRPVTSADLRSFEQESFEIPERAEEAVVQKQARIVEEVVVSKQVSEHTESVRDTLRRTDVEVESIPQQEAALGFDRYSDDFQRNFKKNCAESGMTFNDYAPAYRYGCGLAGDPRYTGFDWSQLESDARRGWDARNPGTWERFKDAIRYAFEKVKGYEDAQRP
jgi:uncharacterized protein (TIGR02271 family)